MCPGFLRGTIVETGREAATRSQETADRDRVTARNLSTGGPLETGKGVDDLFIWYHGGNEMTLSG